MTNETFKERAQALHNYFKAVKELYSYGILINKKDFTCQIGEWFVEMIYDGKRATNGIQKGWDVDVNGKHIQVKSHAKAENNNARYSAIEKYSSERIDELIIIVFTQDYKIKEFYCVPWQNAVAHIKLIGKINPRNEISWDALHTYRVELEKLPNQEIVLLFK